MSIAYYTLSIGCQQFINRVSIIRQSPVNDRKKAIGKGLTGDLRSLNACVSYL